MRILSLVLVWSLFATRTVSAGDCKNVTFHFKNSTGARIKITAVRVVNRSVEPSTPAYEDIANMTLNDGASGTTGKRDLQRLDSGQSAMFDVIYKRLDAATGKYVDILQVYSGPYVCSDEKRFSFTVTAQVDPCGAPCGR